jgi:hypothetical protein
VVQVGSEEIGHAEIKHDFGRRLGGFFLTALGDNTKCGENAYRFLLALFTPEEIP